MLILVKQHTKTLSTYRSALKIYPQGKRERVAKIAKSGNEKVFNLSPVEEKRTQNAGEVDNIAQKRKLLLKRRGNIARNVFLAKVHAVCKNPLA